MHLGKQRASAPPWPRHSEHLNNMNVAWPLLYVLCCVVFCLHQPTTSQPAHTTSQPAHTTSQPGFNQSQLSQPQPSQESLNQSEHRTLLHNQSGRNLSDQIHTRLSQSQSEHNENSANQSKKNTWEVTHKPTTNPNVQWLTDCDTLTPQVDLSYHNLSYLPATFFNASCAGMIQVLDLRHNQLTDLEPKLLTLLTSLQELKVSHNHLTSVPGSVLSRLRFLREMNLSHNQIRLLPYSLPARLGQLDLSFNQLTQLSDGVFHGLRSLKHLDLSHNQLKEIQPHAFEASMATVTWANFSYNQLTAFEPWPYVLSNTVKVDLRHNYISHFTNRMNFTIKRELYGWVDLRYNNLTRFRPRDLGIYLNGSLLNESLSPLKIGVYFQLNIQHNPIICDCHIHWMVKALKGDLLQDSPEAYNYLTCASPPLLRGRPLGFLLSHGYLLVCEVHEGCPEGCRCMNTPHHGYLLVSCDQNLHSYTQLPSHLPGDGLVCLLLSGHALQKLEVGQCDISKLKILDVSHNQVRQVLPSFLEKAIHLEELDLRHNRLTSLPSELQRLSVYKLHLSNNPLVCSCDLASFGNWVKAMLHNVNMTNRNDQQTVGELPQASIELLDMVSAVSNDSRSPHDHYTVDKPSVSTSPQPPPDLVSINCSLAGGRHMPLMNTSQWGLDCQPHHINVSMLAWGGVSLVVVVVGVVMCWRWRYNLHVLLHSTCHRLPALLSKHQTATDDGERSTSQIAPTATDEGERSTSSKKPHVYVSIDEKDDVIQTWVCEWLLPFLENMGHRSLHVYLPLRQEPPGVCQWESRTELISSCPKFLAILSPGYIANSLCRQELDFACCHQQQQCHKNIVIVLKDDVVHQPFFRQPRHLNPRPVVNHHHHHHQGSPVQQPAHSSIICTPLLENRHDEDAARHDEVVVDIHDCPVSRDTEAMPEADKDDIGEQQQGQQGSQSSHNSCCTASVKEDNDPEDHVRKNRISQPTSQGDREILCAQSLANGTHPVILQGATNDIVLHVIGNEGVAHAASRQPVSRRATQQRSVPGHGPTHRKSRPQPCEISPCHLHMTGQPDPTPNTDLDQRPADSVDVPGCSGERRNIRDYFWTKKRRRKSEDSKQQLIETHQSRKEEAKSQRKLIRQKQLEKFSQYQEQDELVAVEPLRSFLLQGRYLSPSDWLFKHKLLFELCRK